MRRPAEIERLYLDFDGFFASVEQQCRPALRGKPVGVVPFAEATRTCVIACSREAKLFGVKNVMAIPEAKEICPDIILVPQSPDLYRRAHNALLSEIATVVPIDAVKSIDEVTCRVTQSQRADPLALGIQIKERIKKHIGPYITCSIGFAANRQLAKMACKAGKRSDGTYGDGNCIWHPSDMPSPLLNLALQDVPGIGARMELRLMRAGITSMAKLLAIEPKHMRKLWRSVTGERLWYALQGYDIQTPPSERGMYGHGRVLPPDHRSLEDARNASRLLIVKAARRMRRDGWNAGRIWLHLEMWERDAFRSAWLPAVRDDKIILSTLEGLWTELRNVLPRRSRVFCVSVTLVDITRADERQLDMLLNDDKERRKAEAITDAIDKLNAKYGRTLVSFGSWIAPPGGYAGGKISYTRIPRAEDFW
ncbi:MAG TPA: type VI secretion protein ImpB [Xanthobacteraceae bacterium]|nr:type VI secretion protein ImpB [Xanthobacteraceae bacterium]